MTNDKAKQLEAFKNSTFIPYIQSNATKLGIYGDFYAVKHFEEIKCFGTAAEALEFYNKQNKSK